MIVSMPAKTAERVTSQTRYVPSIWARVYEISQELGMSNNAAVNLLLREALDARDEKKRADARVAR